jgi:integrase
MRAAYATAIRAERDPAVPSAFLVFGLESNPVEDTDPLAQFTKARDRALSQAELAAFWKRLDDVKSEPVRAALRLALLLGGQRPTQLLRLERDDVDLAGGTLRLLDPKGRRNAPRVHELPLTDAARAVLGPMIDRSKALGCVWIFASDDEHRLAPETVTVEVRYLSAAMFVAGEAKSDFQLRDLRRTCETQLAAMGVSRDLRAKLLCHGLSGVQEKHYDFHSYRDELRAVLERWTLRLTGAEGAVVPIGRRKRKAS